MSENLFKLPADLAAPKPASDHTRKANEAIREALPFADKRSFENAVRGFIASIDPMTITRSDGRVTYDLSGVDFLAQGERDRTAERFGQCIKTYDYERYSYLAQTLLFRMEASPGWPIWLPGNRLSSNRGEEQ